LVVVAVVCFAVQIVIGGRKITYTHGTSSSNNFYRGGIQIFCFHSGNLLLLSFVIVFVVVCLDASIVVVSTILNVVISVSIVNGGRLLYIIWASSS